MMRYYGSGKPTGERGRWRSVLSDRRQRVLSALIEEYVARALPVGSRTLTERYQLGVSPATVRNELSVLEDGGYITQPHTSAGRIPTDFGYRAFVDNLLASDLAGDDERYRPVVDQLRRSASELDALLEQTSSALTRLTEVMGGKSLQEIEDGLGEGMAEAFRDPLVRMALDEVLSCLQEGDASRTHRLGVSSLLTKPEFSQSQALLPVMQVLEDDTVLLQILDDAARQGSGAPSVRIGRENDAAALAGVSVVASRYGRGASAGVVAVVGPTRMDYSKVIQAVRIASAALEDV